METKNLVGKWICSDYLAASLKAPADTAFKVVGHVQHTDLVIVDARRWGWTGLMPGDVVVEECETYKYARLDEITIVSQSLRP